MSRFTRADYMAGRCSFYQYYVQIADELGITMREHPRFVEMYWLLASGKDPHLNLGFPLTFWDKIALGTSERLWRATFKLHGDNDSPAGRVCALKAAVLRDSNLQPTE